MAEQTALADIRADDGRKPDAAVVRDALGVGVAVGLSGFAFGVTSAGSGLTLLQTCALSLLVFTGASQFALVGALAAGGNPFTAAAGAFFLGVRNAFYGLRLSQLLALPRGIRPLAAQWVIDETTAVALAQPTRRGARIGFTVTGLSLYLLWNLTTLLGALGAKALGDTDAWGLDAAGPAVFLALLAPMLKSLTERAVAGLAVLLGLGLLPVLPAGAPVLVAALAAPAVLCLEGRRRGGARADGQDRGPQGRHEDDQHHDQHQEHQEHHEQHEQPGQWRQPGQTEQPEQPEQPGQGRGEESC
ncbi:AzlC family ABC transporter permease [Streptomyces sp. NPDC046197]|uniref:AzlC family ABC transporter permease n=1 Tax=Streptomyces sp. NPDC046197 TaxID=3154337 RepID=UPI0033C4797E